MWFSTSSRPLEQSPIVYINYILSSSFSLAPSSLCFNSHMRLKEGAEPSTLVSVLSCALQWWKITRCPFNKKMKVRMLISTASWGSCGFSVSCQILGLLLMMKCGLFQQRGQFLCCFGLSVASSSVFLVLLLFFVLIFIQQMAFMLFITEYETEFLIDVPRRDATSEL